MTACVCMVDDRWMCDVHGVITPARRAAARYGCAVGDDRLAVQEELAATCYGCCGEPHESGHHPQCSNWTEPVAVHPDQAALL